MIMTRREEIINEIARLRDQLADIDSASRNKDVDKVIAQLTEWGFERDSDGYFCLELDNNVKYYCDLDSYSVWIVDQIDDYEMIYDDYYLTANDMLDGIKNIPELYLVKKTCLVLKYDDGDLDNFEIIKTYKLGS